jgi:hypothetical protein
LVKRYEHAIHSFVSSLLHLIVAVASRFQPDKCFSSDFFYEEKSITDDGLISEKSSSHDDVKVEVPPLNFEFKKHTKCDLHGS